MWPACPAQIAICCASTNRYRNSPPSKVEPVPEAAPQENFVPNLVANFIEMGISRPSWRQSIRQSPGNAVFGTSSKVESMLRNGHSSFSQPELSSAGDRDLSSSVNLTCPGLRDASAGFPSLHPQLILGQPPIGFFA